MEDLKKKNYIKISVNIRILVEKILKNKLQTFPNVMFGYSYKAMIV